MTSARREALNCRPRSAHCSFLQSRVPVTPMKVGGKTQQKKAPAKRAPSVGGAHLNDLSPAAVPASSHALKSASRLRKPGDDGLKDLEAKGAMTGGVAEPYRAAAKKVPVSSRLRSFLPMRLACLDDGRRVFL